MSDRAPSWLTAVPFAHRGAWSPEAPENSLAAIRRAVDAGFGIEVDVRATRDRVLIAHHDEHADRSLGLDVAVRSATIADLRAGRLFGTDERLATLAEVLEVVRGRVPLLVEVKPERTRRLDVLRAVAEMLRDYDGPVGVQSFDPRHVVALRRRWPDLLRGQLLGIRPGARGVPTALRWLLDRHPTRDLAAPDYAAVAVWLLAAGGGPGVDGPVIAWPVDADSDLRPVARAADNIIVDPSDTATLAEVGERWTRARASAADGRGAITED